MVGSPRDNKVPCWDRDQQRPLFEQNDVDEVVDAGQRGQDPSDGCIIKIPNHRQLRVALEQREYGWKRCTKLVFQRLLESLEGLDKALKMERHPIVLPKQHI
jgi:hypothetical protein